MNEKQAYWVGNLVIVVLMLNMLPDVWLMSYGHNYGSPNIPFAFPLWVFMELGLLVLSYRSLRNQSSEVKQT